MSNIGAAHLCTMKSIKQVVMIADKVCHGASSSHQVVPLVSNIVAAHHCTMKWIKQVVKIVDKL